MAKLRLLNPLEGGGGRKHVLRLGRRAEFGRRFNGSWWWWEGLLVNLQEEWQSTDHGQGHWLKHFPDHQQEVPAQQWVLWAHHTYTWSCLIIQSIWGWPTIKLSNTPRNVLLGYYDALCASKEWDSKACLHYGLNKSNNYVQNWLSNIWLTISQRGCVLPGLCTIPSNKTVAAKFCLIILHTLIHFTPANVHHQCSCGTLTAAGGGWCIKSTCPQLGAKWQSICNLP